MKALVIGLGMGQQYKEWLTELGYSVTTVDKDTAKAADYTFYGDAVDVNFYDIIYIGTPNWTHESIARMVAEHTKLLLIEKPGVVNSSIWKQLVSEFPNTRIMMVKNNQYRDWINGAKQLVEQCKQVTVRWNNRNRIPHPGSWFTTKDLAFGGVSRDLIPHMLSYYCALTNYSSGVKLYSQALQRHELKDIVDTDYGSVNHAGTYNVDDFCELEYKNGNTRWVLTANWKDDREDDSSIDFVLQDQTIQYKLGLCPKEAYQQMIQMAVANLANEQFWQNQLEQDIWIHKQIEHL